MDGRGVGSEWYRCKWVVVHLITEVFSSKQCGCVVKQSEYVQHFDYANLLVNKPPTKTSI